MSAPTGDRPGRDFAESPHGPAEVRAAVAELSPDLTAWDAGLDKVYAQSLAEGSLDPLRTFLDDSWHSVLQAREINRNGPAPRSRRVSREQFIADWEARNEPV